LYYFSLSNFLPIYFTETACWSSWRCVHL